MKTKTKVLRTLLLLDIRRSGASKTVWALPFEKFSSSWNHKTYRLQPYTIPTYNIILFENLIKDKNNFLTIS